MKNILQDRLGVQLLYYVRCAHLILQVRPVKLTKTENVITRPGLKLFPINDKQIYVICKYM